jgi:peptidoglycan/xylan/chitin deacetylase (PgdA/CDA1 family)
VFLYHQVGEARASTSVDLAQFEAHLEVLSRGGFTVWPLERAVRDVLSGRPVPDRTVVLAVEDAHRSVLTRMLPRLEARGWPLTVFVSTDDVDRGARGRLGWRELRALRARGVSFANHTAGHARLTRRPREAEGPWRTRVSRDLLRAQARLEAELGEVPRFLLYPYGECDETLGTLVRQLGFVGFGQQSGPLAPTSDPRCLPSFPLSRLHGSARAFREKAECLPVAVESFTRAGGVVTLSLAAGAPEPDRISCFVAGRPVKLWREAPRSWRIEVPARIPVRLTCTAPTGEPGRFYWLGLPFGG